MADTNLGTYSPDDMVCIITLGDVSHPVSGFAEGTMVTAARTNPISTMISGADRSGYRVYRSNKTGSITLSLIQSTSSNDLLQGIIDKDELSRDVFFEMFVADTSGRSWFRATQCFIENQPEASFSTEGEQRDWMITALELEQHLGGNAKVPADVALQLEKLGFPVPDRWKQ